MYVPPGSINTSEALRWLDYMLSRPEPFQFWLEELQKYATIEQLLPYGREKMSATEWTTIVNDHLKKPESPLGRSLASLDKRGQCPTVITALTHESSTSISLKKNDALSISCAFAQLHLYVSKGALLNCLVTEGLLAHGRENMSVQTWSALIDDRLKDPKHALEKSIQVVKNDRQLPVIIQALSSQSFASLSEKNLGILTNFLARVFPSAPIATDASQKPRGSQSS